jgi:hypothetical protein
MAAVRRTQNDTPSGDALTRFGGAKASRKGKEHLKAIRSRCPSNGSSKTGLQPCSILAGQINRAEPRYSAKDHHIFDITARPRPLSVTESIALPPQPKGGRYVKYQQIQYSRVARAPDIAADLFCAVGGQRDDYSVVVQLGGFPLSAQANGSFAPVKRPLSLLADELNIRATAALDKAREMPSGVRRAKAMNKAMILRNALEIHEHFLGKGGAPAR